MSETVIDYKFHKWHFSHSGNQSVGPGFLKSFLKWLESG